MNNNNENYENNIDLSYYLNKENELKKNKHYEEALQIWSYEYYQKLTKYFIFNKLCKNQSFESFYFQTVVFPDFITNPNISHFVFTNCILPILINDNKINIQFYKDIIFGLPYINSNIVDKFKSLSFLKKYKKYEFDYNFLPLVYSHNICDFSKNCIKFSPYFFHFTYDLDNKNSFFFSRKTNSYNYNNKNLMLDFPVKYIDIHFLLNENMNQNANINQPQNLIDPEDIENNLNNQILNVLLNTNFFNFVNFVNFSHITASIDSYLSKDSKFDIQLNYFDNPQNFIFKNISENVINPHEKEHTLYVFNKKKTSIDDIHKNMYYKNEFDDLISFYSFYYFYNFMIFVSNTFTNLNTIKKKYFLLIYYLIKLPYLSNDFYNHLFDKTFFPNKSIQEFKNENLFNLNEFNNLCRNITRFSIYQTIAYFVMNIFLIIFSFYNKIANNKFIKLFKNNNLTELRLKANYYYININLFYYKNIYTPTDIFVGAGFINIFNGKFLQIVKKKLYHIRNDKIYSFILKNSLNTNDNLKFFSDFTNQSGKNLKINYFKNKNEVKDNYKNMVKIFIKNDFEEQSFFVNQLKIFIKNSLFFEYNFSNNFEDVLKKINIANSTADSIAKNEVFYSNIFKNTFFVERTDFIEMKIKELEVFDKLGQNVDELNVIKSYNYITNKSFDINTKLIEDYQTFFYNMEKYSVFSELKKFKDVFKLLFFDLYSQKLLDFIIEYDDINLFKKSYKFTKFSNKDKDDKEYYNIQIIKILISLEHRLKDKRVRLLKNELKKNIQIFKYDNFKYDKELSLCKLLFEQDVDIDNDNKELSEHFSERTYNQKLFDSILILLFFASDILFGSLIIELPNYLVAFIRYILKIPENRYRITSKTLKYIFSLIICYYLYHRYMYYIGLIYNYKYFT